MRELRLDLGSLCNTVTSKGGVDSWDMRAELVDGVPAFGIKRDELTPGQLQKARGTIAVSSVLSGNGFAVKYDFWTPVEGIIVDGTQFETQEFNALHFSDEFPELRLWLPDGQEVDSGVPEATRDNVALTLCAVAKNHRIMNPNRVATQQIQSVNLG